MDGERPRVCGRKFCVQLSGKCNDAHLPWVSRFQSIGQVKVDSPEKSDYILLFCPITSRVGTDISEALENIPGDKDVILVVMHHTFSRDYVVAESRRQVNNSKVLLVVDTLFFEGRPLESNLNETAWSEIKRSLDADGSAKAPLVIKGSINKCMRTNTMKILISTCIVAAVIVMLLLLRHFCPTCYYF